MAWFDRFFGHPGSSSYRYSEGDEYPGYRSNYPHQIYGGWHGPDIFQEPWRGRGRSYSPERPSYSSERPSYSYDGPSYDIDDRPSYNTNDRPTYNTNDRPTYNNERVSYPPYVSATEAADREIALGLSGEEQYRRRNYSMDADLDADSDEELARAMQDSMDLNGYRAPRITPDIPPIFRPPVPRPSAMGSCAGCNEPLGYGRYLSCMGKNWHPDCFRCKMCSKPIADREFSVQEGETYHRGCYKELFHPKCEVCEKFIPSNAAGLIEYRSHPFWNQKYCPRHERDGTPRCCSCDRIEYKPHDGLKREQENPYNDKKSLNTTGLQTGKVKLSTLEDGRPLCSECWETAVVDTKECQPLYRDILKFYKNVGMMIDQEVPMLLVARTALNEARESEKDGMHSTSETRGLCLSEEQTITSVFGGKPRFPWGGPSSMWTEPQKLVRHCEVTAILVLYGLPRLLTGSILAHELMHAWLRLAGGFPHMRPEVEEGICQVMSHIWLAAELKKRNNQSASGGKGFTSPAQARLGDFYLHQIAHDSSPIYGDGFRRAFAAVNQYGLPRVLEHLRVTANFP